MNAGLPVNSDVPTVPTAAVTLPLSGRARVRASAFFKLVMQCAVVGALAYGSYFLVTHFVLQSVQVVGSSMAPTLADTERCLLNRWVYLIRKPKLTEIVVLRDPADGGYAVKRIIGGTGDSIYLKGGRVYVNGHELKEPYLASGTPTFPSSRAREEWWLCGKDQYFVLGDNRNNSADSRIYGAVSRQKILGVIVH